jgi:hypothetical protein
VWEGAKMVKHCMYNVVFNTARKNSPSHASLIIPFYMNSGVPYLLANFLWRPLGIWVGPAGQVFARVKTEDGLITDIPINASYLQDYAFGNFSGYTTNLGRMVDSLLTPGPDFMKIIGLCQGGEGGRYTNVAELRDKRFSPEMMHFINGAGSYYVRSFDSSMVKYKAIFEKKVLPLLRIDYPEIGEAHKKSTINQLLAELRQSMPEIAVKNMPSISARDIYRNGLTRPVFTKPLVFG